MHFAAQVQCHYCSHVFNVCLHTDQKPGLCQRYVVRCPVNRSNCQIRGAEFSLVATCPENVVVLDDSAAVK
jgi:hypothetical protein